MPEIGFSFHETERKDKNLKFQRWRQNKTRPDHRVEATAWCRRTDFPFGSGVQEGIGTGKPTYLVLVPPQPVLGLLRIGETHEPGWVCQAAPFLVCGEVTTCVPGESEHRRLAWHLWDGAEVWCVTLTVKATSLGEKQECNTEWWTLISHCLTLYLESNYIGERTRKIHLKAPFWKGFFFTCIY